MNDLLFYALLIALLYYFLIYLPQQRKLKEPATTKPLTSSRTTQTEPIISSDNPELTQALTTLLTNLKTFNQTI